MSVEVPTPGVDDSNSSKEALSIEQKDKEGIQELKEKAFEHEIAERLLQSMIEKFSEVGFSEDEELRLRKIFRSYSDQRQWHILSMPYELKNTAFPTYYEKYKKGEMNLEDIMETIRKSGERMKRDIGFHASNKKIEPKSAQDHRGKKILRWDIIGDEQDHRDSDLPRAYFSQDYRNVYREKKPKFLYIISFSKAGKEVKMDYTQNWGRASTLSVIDRVDLKDVDEKVLQRLQQGSPENEKTERSN